MAEIKKMQVAAKQEKNGLVYHKALTDEESKAKHAIAEVSGLDDPAIGDQTPALSAVGYEGQHDLAPPTLRRGQVISHRSSQPGAVRVDGPGQHPIINNETTEGGSTSPRPPLYQHLYQHEELDQTPLVDAELVISDEETTSAGTNAATSDTNSPLPEAPIMAEIFNATPISPRDNIAGSSIQAAPTLKDLWSNTTVRVVLVIVGVLVVALVIGLVVGLFHGTRPIVIELDDEVVSESFTEAVPIEIGADEEIATGSYIEMTSEDGSYDDR